MDFTPTARGRVSCTERTRSKTSEEGLQASALPKWVGMKKYKDATLNPKPYKGLCQKTVVRLSESSRYQTSPQCNVGTKVESVARGYMLEGVIIDYARSLYSRSCMPLGISGSELYCRSSPA